MTEILILACASSSREFLMMYSTYELNKQGDNIQPWRTPFPIWNQSVVPCPVLTIACWPASRFLKRQVRWSGIPISFRIFHSWNSLAFWWSSRCWQLNLCSSAFYKTSLNIWKFTVHILLKPGLENFDHTLLACELFQILKLTLWKCCTHYSSKFGNLSHGHMIGKSQFSFQSQRKAIPKNTQTNPQLHSSHTLVK